MVRVDNIIQNGNVLIFNYYPELGTDKGIGQYDLLTGEYDFIQKPKDPSYASRGYLGRAVCVVRRAVEKQADHTNLVFESEYKGHWA